MNGSDPPEIHRPEDDGPARAEGSGTPRDRPEGQELAEFYSHAACGHHSLDSNGKFLLINDTELGWLGYTRDEVVGKLGFQDICTDASRLAFLENFERFKGGGKKHSIEYDLVRKDGSLLPVLLSATSVLDPAGRYLRSRATVFDLTDRRRVERELREALEEAEDLYDNSPCGYHSIIES